MNQSEGRPDLLARLERVFRELRANRPKVKQDTAAASAGLDQGTVSKRFGKDRADMRLGIDSFAGLLEAYGIDLVGTLEFLVNTNDLPKRVQSFLTATEGRASTVERLCVIALARRDAPQPIEIADLDTLLTRARDHDDPRVGAIIALGALAGLRPSEILRAQVGDLNHDILTVGARASKNSHSRRQLPLAASAMAMLAPQLQTAPATPIVPTVTGLHWQGNNYSRWIGPILAPWPTKALRKTFATEAIRGGATPDTVDAYLGHQSHSVSRITARHYLQAIAIRELREVAQTIQTVVEQATRLPP